MNKKELEEHRKLLIELCKDYKLRIDKAIEYIKEYTKEFNFDNDKLIDILEILGDKENE